MMLMLHALVACNEGNKVGKGGRGVVVREHGQGKGGESGVGGGDEGGEGGGSKGGGRGEADADRSMGHEVTLRQNQSQSQ